MFTKESINKIQAAERQLKEAIQLFFEKRDPVAIHTLGMASHEILYQLAKPKGIQGLLKNPDLIKDEYWKDYLSFINQHRNFFKHAKKDPHEVIEFPSEVNVLVITDCVVLYFQLVDHTWLGAARVWHVWVTLKYPQWLKEDHPINTFIKKHFPPDVNPDDFAFFLTLLNKIED